MRFFGPGSGPGLMPVHMLRLSLAQHATASYLSIIHTKGGSCEYTKNDKSVKKI